MSGSARPILLHPLDTVLVCAGNVTAGDQLLIDDVEVSAPESIMVGHKIARRSLNPGDQVVKYGAAIGSMTESAAAGTWVHSHNMRSDYLASHTRDGVRLEDK